MKIFHLIFFVSLFLVSCSTTRISWIPIYSINGGGENESSFNSEKSLIINPHTNTTYAYFKADKHEGIVYSNKYSLAFSKKVTYTVENGSMTLDEANSTKNKLTYLSLSKSLYYAPSQSDTDSLELFYSTENSAIFNDQKFVDGKIIQYDIIGESVGTAAISKVIITDVLPKGLHYKSSEYYFSNKNGAFNHKLSSDGANSTLILNADLTDALQPGQKFIVRVSLEVKKNLMEKIF